MTWVIYYSDYQSKKKCVIEQTCCFSLAAFKFSSLICSMWTWTTDLTLSLLMLRRISCLCWGWTMPRRSKEFSFNLTNERPAKEETYWWLESFIVSGTVLVPVKRPEWIHFENKHRAHPSQTFQDKTSKTWFYILPAARFSQSNQIWNIKIKGSEVLETIFKKIHFLKSGKKNSKKN